MCRHNLAETERLGSETIGGRTVQRYPHEDGNVSHPLKILEGLCLGMQGHSSEGFRQSGIMIRLPFDLGRFWKEIGPPPCSLLLAAIWSVDGP